MTSKSSLSALSMNEYKELLEETAILTKPYSEAGHLYQGNSLLPRPIWFKGSRDRGLREDIAA
tara:strand:+ start:445 stop:633 length:189 start_codon:yes stop_codon:yes gene_type:complete